MYCYEKNSLPIPICDEHPEWVMLYDAAWKLAFSNLDDPKRPGWLPQLSCIPGLGKIWQWDSCFMALYGRYSNNTLPAMNNLDNLYRLQSDDGFLGMAYSVDTERLAFRGRINPPLFSWAEWEYYRVTGDATRFERVFPLLSKHFDWLKENRVRPSGLYWFEDAGASGMDNSPRSAFPVASLDGSQIGWVDLICQQALNASFLARISHHLGISSQTTYYQEEHARLCALINTHHWSERHSFYYDVFDDYPYSSKMNFLNTKTVAAFWALICGATDQGKTEELVRHLLNPNEFWTEHPVPSLAKDNPNYDSMGAYWCGGVWAPTNYMIAAGLKENGQAVVAKALTVKHLTHMASVLKNETFGGIWECYAPEGASPATKNSKGDFVRENFVGWSGLGPIAMLIEHIIGITFDSPSNTIFWRIDSSEAIGLQNIDFNAKKVSLRCDRISSSGLRKISIDNSAPLTVGILLAGGVQSKMLELSAGKHEFTIDSKGCNPCELAETCSLCME